MWDVGVMKWFWAKAIRFSDQHADTNPMLTEFNLLWRTYEVTRAFCLQRSQLVMEVDFFSQRNVAPCPAPLTRSILSGHRGALQCGVMRCGVVFFAVSWGQLIALNYTELNCIEWVGTRRSSMLCCIRYGKVWCDVVHTVLYSTAALDANLATIYSIPSWHTR